MKSHHGARFTVCALALFFTPFATSVYAQANQATAVIHSYSIPASSLDAALAKFGEQSGVLLSYDAALTSKLRSQGLQGQHAPADALARLLAGTGLQAVAQSSGGFVLYPISSGTPVLPAVAVSGKALGSTTEGSGSYTTESTSSSTRLNLSLQETPQPITVITRQRMEDQGLNNLIEILDATIGVTVKGFGVGADAPQMVARGASIGNFQIDGIPSSSSMSNYLQSSVIYDRVEVVKGATGMMSGLGTPSATINMMRKRPTGEALTDVTLEGGTWSRYGAGVDVSRALNEDATVRGRLVADYKNQDLWTDTYNQEYRVLYGIGEVDLGINTLFTLGFSHITRDTDAPVRSFPILYSNRQATGATPAHGAAPDWSYYNHQHNNVFSSLEHTFDSGWVAKAEISHSRYKYDAVIASLGGAVDAVTGQGTFVQSPHWANEAEQTSVDTYITGPFSLFGRHHEVIAGITLSDLDQQSPGYNVVRQNLTNSFNWTNEAERPVHTQTSRSKSQEQQYGAYISTRLQLTDATSLLLGGRFTDWARERKSLTLATGSLSKTRDSEHNVAIPYVGLVHALNDTWSLYSSYTKIFNPQGNGVRDVNNMPLDPEEGVGYEAGIKASLNEERLNASLSLFRTDRDNLAQWSSAQFAYESLNDASTEGVEIEINGELMPGWQFSSGYTYSETTNQHGNRIMTRIPRNAVKLFTSYRLPGNWNKLTLGGGVNWESKTGDPLSVYTQENYAVTNLMARYQVNKQLSITGHLNNALDKEYYVAVAATDGAYGSPRNFMISAKYSF